MDSEATARRLAERMRTGTQKAGFDEERRSIRAKHEHGIEPHEREHFDSGVDVGKRWAEGWASAEALQEAWFIGVHGGNWRTLPALEHEIRETVRLDTTCSGSGGAEFSFWTDDASRLEPAFMRGWLVG